MTDVGRHPARVLAPNPGPFTLEGTNTWIVGRGPTLVIDPGPDDPAHLATVLRRARPIAAILVTHHHPDHADGTDALARDAGVPVHAFRPEHSEERLINGQTIAAGTTTLRVVHTPGHSADHVVFHDAESGALFTGDAVLGRGTSVVDPPDGDMRAYVRSLSLMASLGPRTLYPGHGPIVWSAAERLREYLDHRRMREDQILAALSSRPRSPEDLVPKIYADVDSSLQPLAARSVLAHLLKLEAEGRAVRSGPRGQDRFASAVLGACSRCGRAVVRGGTLCDRCRLAVLQEAPGPPKDAAAEPDVASERPASGPA